MPFPFDCPTEPLSVRKHAPRGYDRYQSYKQWLRDDHLFRCVYCLARERWERTGAEVFGVDHLQAKSDRQDLLTRYENLCYCCNRCNDRKSTVALPESLISTALDQHLRIEDDGTVTALTEDGQYLVDLLLLDDPKSREWRGLILGLHQLAQDAVARGQWNQWTIQFSYPAALPDLSSARPPDGNDRPGGIADSAFMMRSEGRLPDFY